MYVQYISPAARLYRMTCVYTSTTHDTVALLGAYIFFCKLHILIYNMNKYLSTVLKTHILD